MHPFYGPSGRILAGRSESAAGLVSMAAYLAFWAGVVGLAWREYRTWKPVADHVDADHGDADHGDADHGDAAIAELRMRFARGEIDQAQFLVMHRTLTRTGRGIGR